MRTGKLTILGREYPLCFSTRVLCDVNEKYGDLNGLNAAMTDGGTPQQLRATMWILAEMLRAGRAYVALQGDDSPTPLTEEQLLDAFGTDDLLGLYGEIMSTITSGTSREVEAEPPKNGSSTRDNG